MKRSRLIFLVLLVSVVLLSAVAVVHAKYRSRLLFVELKRLDGKADQIDIEWNRLLIEHGAWGAPHRIEADAGKELGMRLPRPEEVIVIKGTDGNET